MVTLIDFYKLLIHEAFDNFEPVWRLDTEYKQGFRWMKCNYPNQEQLLLTNRQHDTPVLIYSIVLPEPYKRTTIGNEIRRYASDYELSLAHWDGKLWLNATVSTENLHDSIMGFIHQARGQLMNIIDCTIELQEESRITPPINEEPNSIMTGD